MKSASLSNRNDKILLYKCLLKVQDFKIDGYLKLIPVLCTCSIHIFDSPALVSVSARGKGQQKGAKKVFESASVWEPLKKHL
jgi:hypothetical protein